MSFLNLISFIFIQQPKLAKKKAPKHLMTIPTTSWVELMEYWGGREGCVMTRKENREGLETRHVSSVWYVFFSLFHYIYTLINVLRYGDPVYVTTTTAHHHYNKRPPQNEEQGRIQQQGSITTERGSRHISSPLVCFFYSFFWWLSLTTLTIVTHRYSTAWLWYDKAQMMSYDIVWALSEFFFFGLFN